MDRNASLRRSRNRHRLSDLIMFPSGRETLNSLVISVLNKGTGVAIAGTPWEDLLDVVEPDTTHVKTIYKLEERYVLADVSLMDFAPDTRGRLHYPDSSQEVITLRHGADSSHDLLHGMHEVFRSLQPGGRFIGIVSSLPTNACQEPFTVTPYWFKEIVEGAGMKMMRMYPGPNAMSKFIRNASGTGPTDFEIPGDHLDDALAEYGLREGGYKAANVLRLMFSATFTFDAVKPSMAN